MEGPWWVRGQGQRWPLGRCWGLWPSLWPWLVALGVPGKRAAAPQGSSRCFTRGCGPSGEVSCGPCVPPWRWDGALPPSPGGIAGSRALCPGCIQAAAGPMAGAARGTVQLEGLTPARDSPGGWLWEQWQLFPCGRGFLEGIAQFCSRSDCPDLPVTPTPTEAQVPPRRVPRALPKVGAATAPQCKWVKLCTPSADPCPGTDSPCSSAPLSPRAGHSRSPLGPWSSWVPVCPHTPVTHAHGDPRPVALASAHPQAGGVHTQ